jgi:hypothetical protein
MRLGYRLSNLSETPQHFIWAIHPLLRLVAGDELVLPASTRALLNGEIWLDAVTAAMPEKGCSKLFASPVSEGWVAIQNDTLGDRLEFAWDPAENNTLGLWLTRGGWHGHHHFAIEPTNATHDSLAAAASQNQCGTIEAHGSLAWRLSLRLGLD